MQEQLLTKCPHCGTTFRLSSEHLEIAGGAVRCGACYQVFHAKEHIVKTAVVEEIRQPEKQEEAPDPFEEFELEDGDPYAETPDWSADEHPDADLFEENYNDPVNEAETLKEFGIEPEPEAPPKKVAKDGADESWAEALLEEMGDDDADEDASEDELIQDDPAEDSNNVSNTGFGGISSASSAFDDDYMEKSEGKSDEITESFKDLHVETFHKFGIEDSDDDTPSNKNDESWAQKMLEELESEEAPKPPSLEELSILDDTPTNDTKSGNNPFAAKELSRNKEDAIAQARLKAREEAKKQREQEKSARPAKQDDTEDALEISDDFAKATADDDAFFGELTDTLPEDVDLSDMEDLIADDRSSNTDKGLLDLPEAQDEDILEQQLAVSELHFGEETKKKGNGLKTFALVFLNIAAIVGLAAQHAYFNFDELARQAHYRPYFEMLCNSLGCNLPNQVDISKIQGTNLVVRSHPMEPNALVIDAIVYNRAKHSQPYPDLELSFEDINGKPIASRRFIPKEYIQDSNIDFNKMPSNTPVHLTLEIVDPGANAVNYQIDFLPQTASR